MFIKFIADVLNDKCIDLKIHENQFKNGKNVTVLTFSVMEIFIALFYQVSLNILRRKNKAPKIKQIQSVVYKQLKTHLILRNPMFSKTIASS